MFICFFESFERIIARPASFTPILRLRLIFLLPFQSPSITHPITCPNRTQNTMSETLRLYPSVPFNVRLALKDTTLPRGGGPDGTSPIGILKDTPIGYSTLVMQRRPDLTPPMPNPSYNPSLPSPSPSSLSHSSAPNPSNSHHQLDVETFAPQRWQTWQPKPWTYIPFNGGPRICIGQQFALTEMGYTIVRLLQRYEGVVGWMDGVDGGVPCLKAEIVLQPGDGVRVGFVRRSGAGA